MDSYQLLLETERAAGDPLLSSLHQELILLRNGQKKHEKVKYY